MPFSVADRSWCGRTSTNVDRPGLVALKLIVVVEREPLVAGRQIEIDIVRIDVDRRCALVRRGAGEARHRAHPSANVR